MILDRREEFSFFTNISRAVAGDYCCAGVAIKSSYHHSRLYFTMQFSDFRARSPISTPTPPIVAMTEFFSADAVASVHPLPES